MTRFLGWPLVIPGVFCWVPVATHIMSHRLVKTPGIGVKQTWVQTPAPPGKWGQLRWGQPSQVTYCLEAYLLWDMGTRGILSSTYSMSPKSH